MNMDNYPHDTITEDGRLCSMGQHRPGFPRVLYDALHQLGYNGSAPVYRGRMSMALGQDARVGGRHVEKAGWSDFCYFEWIG
jgi:hypothetical protein